jgi:hypothetical protein
VIENSIHEYILMDVVIFIKYTKDKVVVPRVIPRLINGVHDQLCRRGTCAGELVDVDAGARQIVAYALRCGAGREGHHDARICHHLLITVKGVK